MAISTVRDTIRPFQWPANIYLLCTLGFQVVDVFLRITPLQPTSVVWRFSSLNDLLGQTGYILLLLFLFQLLAILLMEEAALTILACSCLFLAAMLLLGAASFSLDAIQLRRRVDAQLLTKFDLASWVSFAKFVTYALIALLFSWSAWRSRNNLKRGAVKTDRVSEDYLVVRGPARKV